MNAALLRLLVSAAARAAEQGTLVEILETAARLIALVRPLLGGPDRGDASGPSTHAR